MPQDPSRSPLQQYQSELRVPKEACLQQAMSRCLYLATIIPVNTHCYPHWQSEQRGQSLS